MQHAQVIMYTTQWCPYCQRARALLRSKGVSFDEIDIDGDPARRGEMITRSGRHTVPQIFIGDHHVGGSDDLHALNGAGGLDRLLTGH
jgi:glutaredoxin 3